MKILYNTNECAIPVGVETGESRRPHYLNSDGRKVITRRILVQVEVEDFETGVREIVSLEDFGALLFDEVSETEYDGAGNVYNTSHPVPPERDSVH